MTTKNHHGDKLLDVATDFFNQSTSGDGAGFNAFNFLTSGGVPVATNEIELNNQNGRILFQSDFESGLDTLNRFHLFYNGVVELPGVVNSSATGGDGFVGHAVTEEGRLPCEIAYSGTANTNQWVIQSQTPMKVRNNETGFFFFTGQFMPENILAPNEISVFARINGGESLIETQANWNIDTLNGSEDSGNPSGILLNLININTFVIFIPQKDNGDVKFGFFIKNKIVFVHEIVKQNTLTFAKGLTNRPMRAEGALIDGSAIFNIGCFDNDAGYSLRTKQETDGGIDANYNINSMSAYAVGSNSNDYYRPFSGGNETNLVSVGAVRIPLVSLKPKQFFPPPRAPSVTNIKNRAIVSFKEINISGRSLNLDDGVFVEIIFNQGSTLLTGATFSITDVNSSVDIDTAATAISAGGTQIYADTIFANQGSFKLSIKPEDLFSNFVNQYTCSDLAAVGVFPQIIDPTITVVATSLSANVVDMTATMVWAEQP